ncbi:MAG: baseplate J/gp47 family protein [Azoarcus sp.]|jgi:phage-related baseplate assembly protein|nr:baseplate J/gp47 family protein [Azoarcus sp.]
MPATDLEISRASGIDLSRLPPPDVIETLDFETILAELKARFLDLYPEEDRTAMAAVINLESEPIAILLQATAYQELLLRARINEAARQCQLASATGSNLDQLAALFGVVRLVVDPGNPDAIPPIAPTWESDARLRERAQLAIEGMSTAGPSESYRFHALSADGGVADASVTSPTPGLVVVTILANAGDGTPTQALLDAVAAHLNDETIRPLTDEVQVQGATLEPYAVEAVLTLFPGPSPEVILTAAQEAVTAYVAATRRIGYDVTRSGLFAALHQSGVQNVTLTSPATDLVVPATAASHCTGITITLAGAPDV